MRLISLIAILSLCSFSAANAQISAGDDRIDPDNPDVDTSRLPPILSLVEVDEPEVSYYQATGVVRAMVRFDVSVRNSGGSDGEYLILATATGGPASTTSRPHSIEPGRIEQSSETLKSEFNCFGATRFAVTVSLVDQWDGLDSRGQPIRPRSLMSVTKWIDAPEHLIKSTSDSFDCSGSDPFADGASIATDLSTEVLTPFLPHVHGFKFGNSFQNNISTPFDFRTGGLCGGMMYTALDYYYLDREIPQQDYRPADHTELHRYIYDRQNTSIGSNLDHWFELRQNPGGVRNTTIFNWGLAERLSDIREFIDRGEPALLGLKGANGSGDHQVIAVGYDLGRFTGGEWANRGEMRVYVYDPNYPNRRRTLVPDLDREIYYYEEVGSELGDVEGVTKIRNYQGYFVDRNYHRKTPPNILNPEYPNDGLMHEIVVTFHIGNDDLREGSQANVTIVFNDGSAQVARDVNGGRRWLEHYDQTISIPLDTPTSVNNLRELRVEHRSGGTGGPDNWDVDRLTVSARGRLREIIYNLGAAPLVRFTDRNRGFIAYLNTGFIPDAHVRQLNFTFVTGGDNLRGGNDNLDVEVMYDDDRIQRVRAVNGFRPWDNNTTATYPVALAEPAPLSDIRGVRLIKSPGNDDWNLDALTIEAVPERGESYVVLDKANTPLWRSTERDPIREFLFDP